MKRVSLLLLSLFVSVQIWAQVAAVKDETLIRTYLEQKNFKLDTTANAIYLNEYGKVIASYSERKFYYEFQVEKLAKVITEEGTGIGTINIELLADQGIKNTQAVVYSLNNGKVSERYLDQDFKITEKGNNRIATLNFKNLKPGNVIYYRYTLTSSDNIILPTWYIQEKYPKLHSLLQVTNEFGIECLIFDNKNVIFPEANMNELDQCKSCSFHDTRPNAADQYRVALWARKDIPAVRTSISDRQLESREFLKTQLIGLQNLKFSRNANSNSYGSSSGRSSEYLGDISLANWTNVNDNLLFGSGKFDVSDGNKAIKNKVKELLGTIEGNVAKAKLIFNFVRDSIKLSDTKTSVFVNKKTSVVFEEKSGNRTEKNLLLNAMLNAAKISADPVVVIAGEHGALKTDYSNYSLLNYCLVSFIEGGSRYFLDAAQPFSSFGLLQSDAYDRDGFLVNRAGAFVTIPKAPKEKRTTLITIKKDEGNKEGQMSVDMQIKLGKLASAELKAYLDKNPGKNTDEVLTGLVSSAMNGNAITLTSVQANHLTEKNSDNPITLTCKGYSDFATIMSKDGFSPYIFKLDNNNMLNPLSMPVVVEDVYMLNITFPAEFNVTKQPSPKNIALADNVVAYSSMINYDASGKNFTLTYTYLDGAKDLSSYDAAELSSFFKAIRDSQSELLY